MGEELLFQSEIGVREVRRELGFAEVVAVGAAGDRQQRRGLDAFGHRKAGEELPPFFQIGDEGRRIREDVLYGKRRADVRFQRALGVPPEDILRRRALPRLHEAPEEIIMVIVHEGIAESFVHGLRVGELRAGADGEDALGDDRLAEEIVERAARLVDLMLPQIGRRGEGPGHIAVEGGVADGEFRFVGVAREDAAEGSGERGENAAAPVAGLDIFLHEGRGRQIFCAFCGPDGEGREHLRRAVHKVSDGDRHIG